MALEGRITRKKNRSPIQKKREKKGKEKGGGEEKKNAKQQAKQTNGAPRTKGCIRCAKRRGGEGGGVATGKHPDDVE